MGDDGRPDGALPEEFSPSRAAMEGSKDGFVKQIVITAKAVAAGTADGSASPASGGGAVFAFLLQLGETF